MQHLDALQTLLMLGTDRVPIPDALQEQAQTWDLETDTAPEKTAATALVYYRQWLQAGFVLPSWAQALPQTEVDAQLEAECSPLASRHLQEILDGKYPDALEEWIQLLQQAQQVLPSLALPALFQRSVNDAALWANLQAAIGQRGQWLLQQNPAWRTLCEPLAEPAAWSTCTGPQRLSLLRGLRQSDSALGLQLLQSTWADEDPTQKPLLLNELQYGLTLADEVFLETCLTERRKETRQMAAELLASLAGSALQQRYLSYLQECVAIKEGKIQLNLPQEAPAAWRSDGVEVNGKAPFSLLQRSAWLFQLLRRLPPGFWSTHWGLAPEEAIPLFAQQDREESWVQALSDACLLHKDIVWQEGLLAWWIKNPHSSTWQNNVGRHLLQHLPSASVQRLLTPFLQRQEYLLDDAHPVTYLLCANTGSWNDELSLALLRPFKQYVLGAGNPFASIWHYSRLLRALAYRCDPQLFPQLNSGWEVDSAFWARWQGEVERMLAVVQFRAKMCRAFAPLG
jgi:hypothetical protein